MKTQREILGRLGAVLLASLALAGAGNGVTAQASLGMPFIGNNHLSFYSTELSSDGVADATRTLLGGRYARRFGSDASATRFSMAVQAAARSLDNANQGIADLSLTAAVTRRMKEIDDNLQITVAATGAVLAWGFDHEDTGIAHMSVPFTAGVAYDIHIGGATLSPYVAPSIAMYDNRTYVNDERTAQTTGWDGVLSWGASLSLREVVLTTGGIHGEPGLPNQSRWTFSAGISF